MCDISTTDPLARKLFKEHKLTLLSTAFLPSEFQPGNVVVTYPRTLVRTPVVYPLDTLVADAPPTPFSKIPYTIIEVTERSHAMEASAVAKLAGVLGDDIDVAAVEAALKASSAERFHVSLEAAYRADLDLAAVEQALLQAHFTPAGQDLLEHGCNLHLVTRTIIANQVVIEGNGDMTLGGFLRIPTVAEGKLKAKTRSKRKIAMERSAAEMVIGFAALRLEHVDAEIRLLGLPRALEMQGDYKPELYAQYSEPNAFSSSDALFTAIVKAD
jgi:hypothetical protein